MGQKIKRALDLSLEILVMGVVAFLVLVVLWQVFTRFAHILPFLSFMKPSKKTDELATFLLIWVALLGAAVATGRGAHLGIDYFVQKLPPRSKIVTEVFVFLCIVLFSLFVMIGGGIDLVQMTFTLKQKSPALGVKMGYVYLAVPISGCFMVLYSVLELLSRLGRLFKGPLLGQESSEKPNP